MNIIFFFVVAHKPSWVWGKDGEASLQIRLGFLSPGNLFTTAPRADVQGRHHSPWAGRMVPPSTESLQALD